MKNKNGPHKKRTIAIVFFVIQALALIGSMLNGGLEELFSEGIAYLVGFFLPTVAGISWLRAAHKEEMTLNKERAPQKSIDRPRNKRIIATVLFIIQAASLYGSSLDGRLDYIFSQNFAYLMGYFSFSIVAVVLLVSAQKEEIAMIEAAKKNESTLIAKSTQAPAQQTVSTLKILRKTTTGVGEITLEELQRERAEIEQRFGELKKVKDLLTPDAYYEAIDALSKEYDEVIAKIKFKL